MTHWPDPFRAAVAFDAAVERYRAKFGEAALPVLPGIGGGGGPGGEAVEVAMLRRAVTMNEPLDFWAIGAALGLRRPSPRAGAFAALRLFRTVPLGRVS